MIFDLFGVRPNVGDIINVNPTIKFPVDNASIELNIKDRYFKIVYTNVNNGNRIIKLNNKIITNTFNVNDCLKENLLEIVD